MKKNVPFIAFCCSIVFLVFSYGIAVGKYEVFPYSIFKLAKEGLQSVLEMTGKSTPWFYKKNLFSNELLYNKAANICNGVNLITRIASDSRLVVELTDMGGNVINKWDVDWFKVWSEEAIHLSKSERPKSRPGTHIHGAVLTAQGELIFNYEYLGLVKMDKQGKVLWKVPRKTHHAVWLADNNNIWVCVRNDYSSLPSKYPSMVNPMVDGILEIDQNGQVVREINLFDVLISNGLAGLLNIAAKLDDENELVLSADPLHTNDVEIFPASLEEGFFRKGDIMVSMRDICTVIVLDSESEKVKFRVTGTVNRQHDPDFISGNALSIFDNNPFLGPDGKRQSRIVIVDAPSGDQKVYFEGSELKPFYTDFLGKHQWLPNGNLLIVESRRGRAFELDTAKTIIWEYRNAIGENLVGVVEEVRRYPIAYLSAFNQ